MRKFIFASLILTAFSANLYAADDHMNAKRANGKEIDITLAEPKIRFNNPNFLEYVSFKNKNEVTSFMDDQFDLFKNRLEKDFIKCRSETADAIKILLADSSSSLNKYWDEVDKESFSMSISVGGSIQTRNYYSFEGDLDVRRVKDFSHVYFEGESFADKDTSLGYGFLSDSKPLEYRLPFLKPKLKLKAEIQLALKHDGDGYHIICTDPTATINET